MSNDLFLKRYGPWAVIAGASEGLGAEFARQIAARGVNVVLLARRAEKLTEVATEVRARSGVEVRIASVDLAGANVLEEVRAATADLEIGLVVYNAALSVIGPFVDRPLVTALQMIDVNCCGPVLFAHLF